MLRHRFHWSKLSAISGITRRGKLYFQVYEGSIESKRVKRFLTHLMRHILRHLIVIWDNAPHHRSKEVKKFLEKHKKRMTVEYLPPYAKELNPDEFFWSQIKYHELANFCPKNITELKKGVRHAVVRIRNKPDIISTCKIAF